MFRLRLPRIYQIVEEINRRFCASMHDMGVGRLQGRPYGPAQRRLCEDGESCRRRLAFSVNGVSALHSEILKETVFHDFYTEMPQKFTNVTNGIAHRRWLCQSNPELASLLTELIGPGLYPARG